MMANAEAMFTGGCLCGALRFEADGEPLYAGHCYCGDCRKASGSGFMPFMAFARGAVRFTGAARAFRSPSARGTVSVRNFCALCNSLVHGGERDSSDSFTIYAGALDDPTRFHPTMAIFTRGRPAWAEIPPGLICFPGLPG
jgi:hypothetical protein